MTRQSMTQNVNHDNSHPKYVVRAVSRVILYIASQYRNYGKPCIVQSAGITEEK